MPPAPEMMAFCTIGLLENITPACSGSSFDLADFYMRQ
jgi:hypothetical protein